MKPPHEVLGLQPGASPEEVTQAFRRRTRELHPDVSGTDTTEAMAELNAARDAVLAGLDDSKPWAVATDALRQALNQGYLGDAAVQQAQRMLRGHLEVLADRDRICKARVALLTTWLGQVKLAGDPELMDRLLQEQIDAADAKVADQESHAALSRRALALLTDSL